MARVLVVQHTAEEGLGRFAEWLPAAGLDVHQIHPYLGHRVPAVVEGDALIVLGGPTSAYDDAVAPWLPATRSLLRAAVEDGVPTLGICLGAQLLAAAAGGSVDVPSSAGPELGLATVDVVADDALFTAGAMVTVEWHHDAVGTLPAGAVRCAGNGMSANQAFRVGEVAWGMQFHPEATSELVRGWAENARPMLEAAGRPPQSVVAEVVAADAALAAAGHSLAARFAALVTG